MRLLRRMRVREGGNKFFVGGGDRMDISEAFKCSKHPTSSLPAPQSNGQARSTLVDLVGWTQAEYRECGQDASDGGRVAEGQHPMMEG
jgi:hypothetical protein